MKNYLYELSIYQVDKDDGIMANSTTLFITGIDATLSYGINDELWKFVFFSFSPTLRLFFFFFYTHCFCLGIPVIRQCVPGLIEV